MVNSRCRVAVGAPAAACGCFSFRLLPHPAHMPHQIIRKLWYWMIGGLLFYVTRERRMASPGRPPPIEHWPPISILVPCYNEGDNAEETLATAAAVDYPEFEVIAINDGSRDNTSEVLNHLA